MIYSSACCYAIRAIARLAAMRPDGYVLLDDLCEGTDLPRHFVAKIFQSLVRDGLLTSAKGRGGGFAMSRSPDQITLLDIVAAVDGIDHLDACVVGIARCDDNQPCPEHEGWKQLRCDVKNYLQMTTVASMSHALQTKLDILGQPIPSKTTRSKPVKRINQD